MTAALGPRGHEFWERTTSTYGLTDAERELLLEICRLLDTADTLQAALEVDGTVVEGSKGQPRLHPAVAELRQLRATVGRLLGQLSLPSPEGLPLPTPQQVRGQRAARSRWARQPLRGVS